ncbi:MAG: helix-turn-helix transcriptional regulator [Eubacteriales bacterium]|nr:helix-turn-helix transcriptional regulator [Eubacteriales bacterium]
MSKLRTTIAERRVEAGITQAELAEAVGVRRETIGRLEKGQYNPSLKLAMDLAKILDADIYDLFEFYEEERG